MGAKVAFLVNGLIIIAYVGWAWRRTRGGAASLCVPHRAKRQESRKINALGDAFRQGANAEKGGPWGPPFFEPGVRIAGLLAGDGHGQGVGVAAGDGLG
ncbi:hypothetical protein, partial [Nitrospirillum iridis]|uniref:hypothetical protein n=1 Tax=Nitrospirillum iridis TaxID=765888 RepID=UPI001B3BAD91